MAGIPPPATREGGTADLSVTDRRLRPAVPPDFGTETPLGCLLRDRPSSGAQWPPAPCRGKACLRSLAPQLCAPR
ncbi:hypothetical protein AAFF_G00120600 [Aldrovandia affinis]|uniref:Uncharacterized protein n=1 Tax=Aldrovandia affinis TaxID=143900 RepID=A0AAD7W9Y8_9TELE|nr:hypothetical protein AAFF_G00120600 [Aldrovandia affinis]